MTAFQSSAGLWPARLHHLRRDSAEPERLARLGVAREPPPSPLFADDIRDWGERMAKLRIPLWWGPGRHGPGNNLFFMIEDPEGHKVEFSAELEMMPQDAVYRTWPHEQRTLNLWGSAWMRS